MTSIPFNITDRSDPIHSFPLFASLGIGIGAMALGLAEELWTVRRYVNHPVHVSDLQRDLWAEQRQDLLTSALEARKRMKQLPTS